MQTVKHIVLVPYFPPLKGNMGFCRPISSVPSAASQVCLSLESQKGAILVLSMSLGAIIEGEPGAAQGT